MSQDQMHMGIHDSNTTMYIDHFSEIKEHYDLYLVDINGIVHNGINAYPTAIQTLQKLQTEKRVIFLSNTPRPAALSQQKLADLGLSLNSEIFTSGDAVRLALQTTYDKKKIFHLSASRNKDILTDIDVISVTDLDQADVILLTQFIEGDENVNQLDDYLEKIAKMHIPVICANPDKIALHGQSIRYCAGTFAKRLEDFGGTVQYYGKPDVRIYNMLFDVKNLHHINKKRVLMIGDTLDTDVAGGQAFGINSLLVMTGNTATDIDHLQQRPMDYFKAYTQRHNVMPTYYSKAFAW